MRYTLAALLCLAWAAGAGAQTVAEGRYGSGTDYRVVDLRVIGRGELGVSTGFLQSEGDWSWLVGPTFKWNDARGAWAASVRFGTTPSSACCASSFSRRGPPL
jgi:hypothetical protein